MWLCAHDALPDRYQEFKAWQAELAELNKVDSHAMEKEEKVRHRDRMVELAKNIRDTKEHFSGVSQPHVHPHATLEDNIKMHKLYVCGSHAVNLSVCNSFHALWSVVVASRPATLWLDLFLLFLCFTPRRVSTLQV